MDWITDLEQQIAGSRELHCDALFAVADRLASLDPITTDRLLTLLAAQRDTLSERIGTYPGNAVNAKDWMDGVGLGQFAEHLAHHLMAAEMWQFEVRARELAVNIGCIVEGHYHHVIGPRMVMLIRAVDRLQNDEQIRAICDAVVGDFMWILEEEIEDDSELSAERATSIWSLKVALEREADLPSPPGRPFTAADADKVLERAQHLLQSTES